MKDKKSFSIRLAELVKPTSIRRFAKLCDVSEGSLRRYLKEDSDPSLAHVKAIAVAGGVSVGWLIGEEDNENGKIVATFEPGDQNKKAKLIAQGIRAEQRSNELKRIAAWMDAEEEKNPDFGWLFERELERNHPSYTEFLNSLEEKKRPGADYSVAEPARKYKHTDRK